MIIFVITRFGDKITLDVEPTDTIKAVQQKIADNFPHKGDLGFETTFQQLVFDRSIVACRRLTDPYCDCLRSRTLEDWNIHHESTLHLVGGWSQLPTFVLVKSTNPDSSIYVRVDPGITAESVKAQLSQKLGISLDSYYLLFRQQILEDEQKLQDCGVHFFPHCEQCGCNSIESFDPEPYTMYLKPQVILTVVGKLTDDILDIQFLNMAGDQVITVSYRMCFSIVGVLRSLLRQKYGPRIRLVTPEGQILDGPDDDKLVVALGLNDSRRVGAHMFASPSSTCDDPRHRSDWIYKCQQHIPLAEQLPLTVSS
eukprot:gnl/MRDRNA2_/MRDRNA2_84007_c0_seq1.p1 gnl/MRDRNA2_/MRDRNA2_84007_c0~~gnl/MRDRNA2_/MRDRNA2_84007_c0_seq1.p1  ORF type:complete len:311 (+),score=32.31 gnl/MRDRNA2_/MRDRNA2_84007_c0_seq1:3-935(+)